MGIHMSSILVVEKNGSIVPSKIKHDKLDDLYKKAGCKSPNDFKEHAFWQVEVANKKYGLHVFGRVDGRAGQENKYDFPPPIDNTLFFGKCIILMKNQDKKLMDLTEVQWKIIYEGLFGGFEDIGEEDSEDEEEDEEEENIPKTKEGYAKDGFIVEDDEEDEEEYEDEDEDELEDDEDEDEDENEDEEEIPRPKAKKMKTRSSNKKQVAPQNVFINTSKYEEELECTSELSEESYE